MHLSEIFSRKRPSSKWFFLTSLYHLSMKDIHTLQFNITFNHLLSFFILLKLYNLVLSILSSVSVTKLNQLHKQAYTDTDAEYSLHRKIDCKWNSPSRLKDPFIIIPSVPPFKRPSSPLGRGSSLLSLNSLSSLKQQESVTIKSLY